MIDLSVLSKEKLNTLRNDIDAAIYQMDASARQKTLEDIKEDPIYKVYIDAIKNFREKFSSKINLTMEVTLDEDLSYTCFYGEHPRATILDKPIRQWMKDNLGIDLIETREILYKKHPLQYPHSIDTLVKGDLSK